MNEDLTNDLPDGIRKLSLKQISDSRGSLMEIYRAEWFADAPFALQWNVNFNKSGTFRGFHVHWAHDDFLCAISGKLHLGLQDMRPWSPTYEMAVLTTLNAEKPELIHIPPGIGHGFWYDQEAIHIYGVSEYWNPHDELACRWDDKDIKVPWPFTEPAMLSEKDQKAGTYEQMKTSLLSQLMPPTST
ncbi:dTDP-4-dehydrorhamnose 3,5-epimerase family protein [Paenibacillus sp. YIM B09110]|uniref:dTDP-4-dehydrorhamnose 3,5-epimerase family protein n=1 Tax=Paenibacillus sp. YIM B09110 TaxID=3126102 RepID=UPI00301DE359